MEYLLPERIDVETYQALCSFLNIGKGLKEVEELQKEEKINMCQAMEEWYQDALEEGREAGRSVYRHREGRSRRLRRKRESRRAK